MKAKLGLTEKQYSRGFEVRIFFDKKTQDKIKRKLNRAWDKFQLHDLEIDFEFEEVDKRM